MKSVVQLDISVPQATVAELFADPANNPMWMDDLARVEPMNGKLGAAGLRLQARAKARINGVCRDGTLTRPSQGGETVFG
jgi:hypothetical protein